MVLSSFFLFVVFMIFILVAVGVFDYLLSFAYRYLLNTASYQKALSIRYVYQFISLFNVYYYLFRPNRIICILTEGYTLNIVSKNVLLRIMFFVGRIISYTNSVSKSQYINSHISLIKSGKYPLGIYDNFLNIINGQTVAVVGPAYSVKEDGAEIDGYDIVIRTSYGFYSELDPKIYGVRTDVSFFNNEASDLYGEQFFEKISKILFIVFKLNLFPFQNNMVLKNKAKFSEDYKIFDPGGANQIPIIIQDLLHYNPKKIKVFKSDLYTNSVLCDNIDIKNNIIIPLTVHDCFSQILFLKFIKKVTNNMVEFDEILDDLINDSVFEYARKLESNYKL